MIVTGFLRLPTASAKAPHPTNRVGLVISGGVSEGSYQAGATYAFMKYLARRRDEANFTPTSLAGSAPNADCGLAASERPSLDVITGSSAGDINAFLAAVTWCAASEQPLRSRENLFWDSWINIGWNMLSPDDPVVDNYPKLFEDPMSQGELRKLDLREVPGLAGPHGSGVYGDDDGLVTRRSFAVGYNRLASLITNGAFRACSVRLGLTATRTQSATLALGQQPVDSERYVVPLEFTTDPSHLGANVTDFVEGSFRARLRSSGLWMALPVKSAADATVSTDAIVRIIKASSAFPFAFAPQELDHCLPGKSDLPAASGFNCPTDMVPAHARFIDGGLLDNQPFGIAESLAESYGSEESHAICKKEQGTAGETKQCEPPRHSKREHQHTLYFLDTSPERNPVAKPPAVVHESNGLSLTASLIWERFNQARGYENLGLARAHTDLQVRRNSRFFPLTSGELPMAFGAFIHPSFRVYDYFIGVYDAIHMIAKALTTKVECDCDPEAANRAGLDTGLPPPEVFKKVAESLIGDDAHLSLFIDRLFAYERQWSDGGRPGTGNLCHFNFPPVPKGTKVAAPFREDQHVAEVFQVLCDRDQASRELARKGQFAALAEYLKKTKGLQRWADNLPHKKEFLGDTPTWEHKNLDRLLRRAIDVERADRAQMPWTNHTFEDGAQVGRFALASLLEREDEIFDLDPSSVERIAGHQWNSATRLWHLVPGTLLWDSFNSRLAMGWEPRVRISRAFIGFGGFFDWFAYERSARPYSLGTSALFGGGWDPSGRWFDDVQLAASYDRELAGQVAKQPSDMVGLELSTHFLGSKFRVGIGAPEVFWARDRGQASFADRFNRFFITLGLGDLNGSLSWLVRWMSDACEEDCPPARTREGAAR